MNPASTLWRSPKTFSCGEVSACASGNRARPLVCFPGVSGKRQISRVVVYPVEFRDDPSFEQRGKFHWLLFLKCVHSNWCMENPSNIGPNIRFFDGVKDHGLS